MTKIGIICGFFRIIIDSNERGDDTMARILSSCEKVERSINKKYRKEIWNAFIAGVKRYELVLEGDRIAVCISGGKDSMLMAKLMQMLQRYSDVPFGLEFLVMDPGYNRRNRELIEHNAQLLEIPITVFESDIFDVTTKVCGYPCYLCAKMRRGHLYSKARELGCNKIALGHHYSDVIETTVMAMLYGAQLQGMMPKLHSTNYEGMELIRPLYCVNERDIISWRNYNKLEFLQCACRFTEDYTNSEDGIGASKRQEVKHLIAELKKKNPNVEKNIFNSIHCVHLDTFPGYKTKGERRSFLDTYYDTEE